MSVALLGFAQIGPTGHVMGKTVIKILMLKVPDLFLFGYNLVQFWANLAHLADTDVTGLCCPMAASSVNGVPDRYFIIFLTFIFLLL